MSLARARSPPKMNTNEQTQTHRFDILWRRICFEAEEDSVHEAPVKDRRLGERDGDPEQGHDNNDGDADGREDREEATPVHDC